jgi:hypothetical protein
MSIATCNMYVLLRRKSRDRRLYNTSGKDTRQKELEQSECPMDCFGKQRRGWKEDKYSYYRWIQDKRRCNKEGSRLVLVGHKEYNTPTKL